MIPPISIKSPTYMKVNCVIVTYNRLRLLKECLNAVEQQSYPIEKIILVDNHSTDSTGQFLQSLSQNTKYRIIQLPENVGGAGGFSIGIKESVMQGCDFIWIMDDDTIATPDALEKLMDIVHCHPHAGFVCSQVKWMDDTQHLMNKPALRNPQAITPVSECMSCSFVSVLIRTQAVYQVGLPIKEFFIWCDDTEYTARITNAGFTNYYVKDSIVYHKTKENYYPSVDKAPAHTAERFYYQVRNSCYIKHRETRSQLLFRFIVWNKLRIMKNRIKRRKDGHQQEFIDAVKRGCKDGLTFYPEIEYIPEPQQQQKKETT